MPTISIITATFNAAQYLPRLIESLCRQTDQDFEWVVMDGGSTDGTLELLAQAKDLPLIWRSEPDFGIYDALNKAIRQSQGEYYLVLGADDQLKPQAVARYRQLATESRPDIVAASVLDSEQIVKPGRGKPWLRGQLAHVSQHAVGTLIQRSLHERVGYYSRMFPIAADQLFIQRAIQGGARVHYAPEFIAGEFARVGVSSTQYAATLFQFTQVQLLTQNNRSLQVLLFIARLVRHWHKVVG